MTDHTISTVNLVIPLRFEVMGENVGAPHFLCVDLGEILNAVNEMNAVK